MAWIKVRDLLSGKDDLISAHREKDDLAFSLAIEKMEKHGSFLNNEIVRYRTALNKIAWGGEHGEELFRRIAIEALNVAAIREGK